jgi:hypothetical protein
MTCLSMSRGIAHGVFYNRLAPHREQFATQWRILAMWIGLDALYPSGRQMDV